MSPKKKSVPSRLGPPPQLLQQQLHALAAQRAASGGHHGHGHHGLHGGQYKPGSIQPKLREIALRQAKLVARWAHANLTWKRVLLAWMVLLVASKMVLLMLTYQFFTMTALISLQIFHGVWTIAFFCLSVINTRAVLPNASCLLAGYLPATTVLHILLIPNNYPLEYIITDAIGTFLAIVTMFLLLRMECTEILHEAEDLWEHRQSMSDVTSESGLSTASTSCSGGGAGSVAIVNTPTGRRILGNPIGPTVISVGKTGGSPALATAMPHPHPASAVPAAVMANYDSMLFGSMDAPRRSVAAAAFDSDADDLEPIDFEHFVDDEPSGGGNSAHRMFSVAERF